VREPAPAQCGCVLRQRRTQPVIWLTLDCPTARISVIRPSWQAWLTRLCARVSAGATRRKGHRLPASPGEGAPELERKKFESDVLGPGFQSGFLARPSRGGSFACGTLSIRPATL